MKSSRRQFVITILSIVAVSSINMFALPQYRGVVSVYKQVSKVSNVDKQSLTSNYGVNSYVTSDGFIAQASEHEYNQFQSRSSKDLIFM